MTKPDDIPQDVWEAARQAFIGMTDLKPEALEAKRVLRGDFDGMPMLVIAARAILAERDACAMRFLTYSDKVAEADRPLEFQHISGAVAAIRTSR